MSISKALEKLNCQNIKSIEFLSFSQYLDKVIENPKLLIRNVFQVFYDMMKFYLGEGYDEYPNDPESIHFLQYDCTKLFVKHSEQPFFADRLFTNRLMNLVETLKIGTKQNKIYVFRGPPGSGKSTFLNNILKKFEEYSNSDFGIRYEIVWRLDTKLLDYNFKDLTNSDDDSGDFVQITNDGCIEIVCPSHDNPILVIPKQQRQNFLRNVFSENKFRKELFHNKEYDWVFKGDTCTICNSLYRALLEKLQSHTKVLEMLYVRPYLPNRRLSDGVSVFNPCDDMPKQTVLTNQSLQKHINLIFHNNKKVKYFYSHYAKTNNGIYALMDVKSNNKERMIQLHNIISEGTHKVDDIEESSNMFLVGIMNPEDQKNIDEIQSFNDRIEYVNIPYVMDMNTEIEIFKHVFGKRKLENNFLPRIVDNFARIIIATRLSRSEAIRKWIGYHDCYKKYCDYNMYILQMEIYAGRIPNWLTEDDRQKLTAKIRREIISEGNTMGSFGVSGRDSINLFNEFCSQFRKENELINIENLCAFFTENVKKIITTKTSLSDDFLLALISLYNYETLQEIKESLYSYNEEQISLDIKNYLFCINFNLGTKQLCNYTGQSIEITNDFLETIEQRILGQEFRNKRADFRKDMQKEYTSKTLTQEIMVENKKIEETHLYKTLYNKYTYNIKEKALDPLVANNNFRAAIKDYGKIEFNTYDNKIKHDVQYLINNLQKKFNYTEKGAKDICIYVIDGEFVNSFIKS
jgi:predicted Ser/Thr protein kinase